MAPHSSTLAWKIPWTEEPGRLQSLVSLRVGDSGLSDFIFTFMHWRRKWQPTPVFLPGESQGQRSLVRCRLWGHTESDTTKVTQQQQQSLSTHTPFKYERLSLLECLDIKTRTLVFFFKGYFFFKIFLLSCHPPRNRYNLTYVGRNGLGESEHCLTCVGSWTVLIGSFMEGSVKPYRTRIKVEVNL